MNEKKLAVRKMQDYISEHLHDPISLKQLSNACFLSPSYASKLFKDYTGYTPYYYIKARRLSEAAKVLRDENIKVLDVALDFVFDSHEGFTRAFSKQFGVSPKRYSKEKPPVKWFLPYPITIKEEEDTMNQFIFTQVIERPKRKVLILRGQTATEYFAYCEEVGCDVWGILSSVKEALYEPAGFWLPGALIKPGTSKYVQGVEVPEDYHNEIPEGFDLIDLPACLMMIFQGQPYDDDFFETAILGMKDAMKDFDPTLYGYEYDDSRAPQFQLEPRGERGYIEGRPIRKL